MIQDDAYVAHSLLSSYLSVGLLNPYEVCKKVHDCVLHNPTIIASAEGFIRQIQGWREHMFYKYHALIPQLLMDAHQEHLNLCLICIGVSLLTRIVYTKQSKIHSIMRIPIIFNDL